VRGFGSVVKPLTADPRPAGIASSIPPNTNFNYLIGDMESFFPGKRLLCISAIHCMRTLKNLVCHVWSALQYLALIGTYNPYAPTPNGNVRVRRYRSAPPPQGTWLSGKTLHCRPTDGKFDPPSHTN